MPIAGTMIDGPMPLVVVAVAIGLEDDVSQEHHASNHVQRMNEGKRERHAIDLGGPIIGTEVLADQIVHAKTLDHDKQ